MKYFLFKILLLILIFLSPLILATEKTLLCFPAIDPSNRELHFQIKASRGTCEKDEKLYEVKRAESGVLLFLPYDSSNPTTQPAPFASPTTPKTGKSIF